MDGSRFDQFSRFLAEPGIQRRALIGLLGGALITRSTAGTIDAKGRRRQALHVEKKRKKKCQSGLLKCTVKQGKKKKKLCVDAQTDPANCGGCGIHCASGQGCQGGVCTCNGTLCRGCCDGTTCRSETSNQQCGANGGVCQVCTGSSSCQNGACTCSAGLTYCAGTCINTKTDAKNCGACGASCTLPQTCGGGGTPGVCGCTPTTCAAQGKNCGSIPDTCGTTLNCGTCNGGASGNETCGGGGTPNVCGCRANGFVFTYEEGNFNCDPCCSGDCCFVSEGVAECAGGCG